MFGRKEQPKKSLNEILEVFTTTQEKLEEFTSEKESEKQEAEAKLDSINNDLTKSKSVLAKLSEILK